ncbi:MAG: helix-turn-helix domain-containing protein [bacterium]|nr:helix-turn-helix domain-containing protein [bacterium]
MEMISETAKQKTKKAAKTEAVVTDEQEMQATKPKERKHAPKVIADMQYMRAAQVCRYIGGLGLTTLYSWIHAGRFPAGKLVTRRCRLWSKAEVDEWLRQHDIEAA